MSRARDEEGFTMITVAISLAVIVAMAWFVVDAANWWVHKRHLQNQADAGALAGAGELRYPNCDESVVRAAAAKYAGIGAGAYNPGTAVGIPDANLGWTFNDGMDAACASGIVDVWVRETNPPWYFRLPGLQSLAEIKAHARVELKVQDVATGLLPIGVEDVRPAKVHVWFYNLADDTANAEPTLLGGADLARRSDAAGVVFWDNSTAPAAVRVAERVGIRVGVSRFASTDLTSPSACSAPGVDCYGLGKTGGGQWNSVSTIRLQEGTPTTEPTLGAVDVTATDASCLPTDNGYFHTGCSTVRVEAVVNGIDPSAATVQINGSNATRVGTTGSRFFRNISTSAGPQELTVSYTQKNGTVAGPTGTTACGNGGKNQPAPCTATWTAAHRTFHGDRLGDEGDLAYAGPIRKLAVVDTTADPVGQTSSENNVAAGKCSEADTTCGLVVEVGLGGYVSVAKPGDPPLALRDSEGSQTGLMDCDAPNLRDEMRDGCSRAYKVNDGDPDCPSTYQNASDVLAGPQPHECVGPQPSDAGQLGQLRDGLNDRIQCKPFGIVCASGVKPTCNAKNNWPDFPQGDPRIVKVFLVPNGSLDGSGASATFPITGFAAFYVTGYTSNPCKGDVDGDGDDDNDLGSLTGNGELIAGHWITNIDPNLNGGGNAACDLTAIDSCVAVMTQ